MYKVACIFDMTLSLLCRVSLWGCLPVSEPYVTDVRVSEEKPMMEGGSDNLS